MHFEKNVYPPSFSPRSIIVDHDAYFQLEQSREKISNPHFVRGLFRRQISDLLRN